MPVTFDEEVTASIWWWRKSGREVMVVEEVSLEDIDRARAEVEVDVAEVEGGSGKWDPSGSALFGFGFRILLLGLLKL